MARRPDMMSENTPLGTREPAMPERPAAMAGRPEPVEQAPSVDLAEDSTTTTTDASRDVRPVETGGEDSPEPVVPEPVPEAAMEARPESVDATADAGTAVEPESAAPETAMPDGSGPELDREPPPEGNDPADRIEDQVAGRLDPSLQDHSPDAGLGGGPAAPTEGGGSGFDADDPFGASASTGTPDLSDMAADRVGIDVDAPSGGVPNAGDVVVAPMTDTRYDVITNDDGTIELYNIDTDDLDDDWRITPQADGTVKVESAYPDPDADEEEYGIHDADDLQWMFGVTLPEQPEPVDDGGVQTEFDRLEMRVEQLTDWLFDTGSPDDSSGDYDPDSVGVAPPGEIDTDDPNFQHAISERDGAITWGDHDDSGGDGRPADYDGIDYGEDVTEADIPVAEAADMILGSPWDQPDVDPVDDAAGEDQFLDAE